MRRTAANLAGLGPLGLKAPKPSAAKRRPAAPLRQAAQGEACTLLLPCCNNDRSTVVLCHLRMFGWGGVGMKPDDLLAVFACAACHDALDRRGSSAALGCDPSDVLRALGKTLERQRALGNIITA